MARKSLFQRLEDGFKEGIEHARGERALRVTEVSIPEPPGEYGPKEVLALRSQLGISQAILAKLLHVSHKTVQGWEQGRRSPSGPSARLLQFLEHPEYLRNARPNVSKRSG